MTDLNNISKALTKKMSHDYFLPPETCALEPGALRNSCIEMRDTKISPTQMFSNTYNQ